VGTLMCALVLRTEADALRRREHSMLLVPRYSWGIEVHPILTAYSSETY
jgi:hypothetical protein